MPVFNKKSFKDNPRYNEDDFIKISLSPENRMVPDLNNDLPGKSVWLPANKELITDILKKEDFRTYFGTKELLTADLGFLIEKVLRKKILGCLSLAKKAGVLAIGLDTITLQLGQRKHCLIISARGAKSLKSKSFYSSKNVAVFESIFDQKDLERCTGKNNVKYVGILSKNFKKTIQVDLNKLKGFIDNH